MCRVVPAWVPSTGGWGGSPVRVLTREGPPPPFPAKAPKSSFCLSELWGEDSSRQSWRVVGAHTTQSPQVAGRIPPVPLGLVGGPTGAVWGAAFPVGSLVVAWSVVGEASFFSAFPPPPPVSSPPKASAHVTLLFQCALGWFGRVMVGRCSVLGGGQRGWWCPSLFLPSFFQPQGPPPLLVFPHVAVCPRTCALPSA